MTQVFVIGKSQLPPALKKENRFSLALINDPYSLKNRLQVEGEKIVVVYLPFIEQRHFDMYSYLQKSHKNTQIFFVVNELSGPMKIRLKTDRKFIVLWKTEEHQLLNDIHSYLQGKELELREDKRRHHAPKPLVAPSTLPIGKTNTFKPIRGGEFKNISENGTCISVKNTTYKKKDFVNLTYQNKAGEFKSVEGQVRWEKSSSDGDSQELGIQFVTQ